MKAKRALRTLLACAAVSLGLPQNSQAQSGVSIAFNNVGLSSIQYNGTEFLQYGDFRLDLVTFLNSDGTTFTGDTGSTVAIDSVQQTQTRTYDWGTIVTHYSVVGNQLNVQVVVQNRLPNTIQGILLEPLGLNFPSAIQEFAPGYPLITNTLGQPGIQSMTYSSGTMVLAADDVLKPLQLGFPYTFNSPASTMFPITLNTDRVSSYCGCYPTINRPIAPYGSDTFLFSLRFGPAGSTATSLASDVYQNFATAFPPTFSWPDHRPIGSLHLSTLTQGLTGWSTNPRGWLSDKTIDVTTPAGIANLQQRILSYADYSISIMQIMNAQGMITWDLEGQQFPGYIGDPTALVTVAPEMAGIVDAYFQRFTAAGFKIGVNLRPQQLAVAPDGSSIQEYFVPNPTQLLLAKATYAHARWGATLFYVDSNVNSATDPNAIDPTIFKTLQAALPDSLFSPEHSVAQYWGYSAPYMELAGGFTSTPAGDRFMYPNSFSVIYTADGPIQQSFSSLVTAVQHGDILLYRSWWNDPQNQLVQSIYQTAGVSSPTVVSVNPTASTTGAGQAVQFTSIVAGTVNQQVTWRIAGGGVGSLSPSGLYTAPGSIAAQQTITIQATSVADTTKLGTAFLTLSPQVGISLIPQSGSLGPNQLLQFTPVVTGNTNSHVTWLLASGSPGTLSPSGLYTAPASITSQQTISVQATSAADPTKSVTATITLNPAAAVLLNPLTGTLTAGQTLQFSTVTEGISQVNWSISPSGAGTISSSGSYTAPMSITSRQAITVQATSVSDATKFATATVTLVPTVAISLNPTSGTLTASQTIQFTPTLSGTTNQQVTWNLSPAGIGAISPAGLYTAPAFVASQQTVAVQATSLADATKYATATVTLNPTVTVSLNVTTGVLTRGQTLQLSATVTGTANQQVNWTLAPSGAGAISPSGLYTAPASILSQQAVTVQATSLADSTKSASAIITLSPSICPGPSTNAFTGCYYPDTVFGASSGLGFSRVDPQINFNWYASGPGSGFGPYNFSVRWQGNFTFSAGAYTFTLSTDDGSILYIDGQQVINDWSVHAAYPLTQAVTLTAGTHLIEFDYFQAGGNASASLTWTNTPLLVSISPTLGNLNAGQTQQFSTGVTGSSNQQVTWNILPTGMGSISSSGLYTAPAQVATQQTVTVQATSVADPTKSATATLILPPSTSSSAGPSPSCATPGTNVFTGCYYLDTAFGNSNGLGFKRIDPQINFNWYTNGPGSGVGPYNFSVRWQGYFSFAALPYAFTLSTDDGSILYIDGQAVMNEWGIHGASPTTQTVTLSAGSHLIELDYYQAGGNASASLSWTNGSAPIGISLSPTSSTLNAGQTQQFTPTVTGTANQQVTWSISPAGAGAVSSSGLYTAPASVTSQQTVSVQATSEMDPTKSAAATVTLTPSTTTSGSCGPPSTNAFTGCYYLDTTFGTSNGLGFSRVDPQINFNWYTNGPGSGVGPYNFSVRWQGYFTFDASAYTFTLSTDDGSMLLIDGQQVVNEWGVHAAYPTSQTVTLTAGAHLIEVDYYQVGGGASANLSWTNPALGISISPTAGNLNAGQTLQLTADVTGTANQQVNWSISPAGMGTISSSGLYTAPPWVTTQQTVAVQATSAADGTKTATASISLSPSAAISAPLNASCAPPGTNAFTGCYYLDTNFGSSSGLGFTRVDPQINFNWGTDGPGSGMGAYNFSVRWQGAFTFTGGTYTFTLATDDGSVLYIDGQQVASEWGAHGSYPLNQSVALSAGTHLIEVDYFQIGGGASASLNWTRGN